MDGSKMVYVHTMNYARANVRYGNSTSTQSDARDLVAYKL
jgi:hypothetical protein